MTKQTLTRWQLELRRDQGMKRWLMDERRYCKTDAEWKRELSLRYKPQEVAHIVECMAAAEDEEAD